MCSNCMRAFTFDHFEHIAIFQKKIKQGINEIKEIAKCSRKCKIVSRLNFKKYPNNRNNKKKALSKKDHAFTYYNTQIWSTAALGYQAKLCLAVLRLTCVKQPIHAEIYFSCLTIGKYGYTVHTVRKRLSNFDSFNVLKQKKSSKQVNKICILANVSGKVCFVFSGKVQMCFLEIRRFFIPIHSISPSKRGSPMFDTCTNNQLTMYFDISKVIIRDTRKLLLGTLSEFEL